MNPLPVKIRVVFFNPWGRGLEQTADYLASLPTQAIAPFVSDPADAHLVGLARLDRDWHAECARCFDQMQSATLDFLPSLITGLEGLPALASACAKRPPGETWWFVLMGQHPQKFAPALSPLCTFLKKNGARILYYAFDEASRTMPCFADLAPHLDVLIHDEAPLAHQNRLSPAARTLHRSWVANFPSFSVPFNDTPEAKIIFLGSQMGLTPHRQRQIDFLRTIFKDRFIASHDHSVSVSDRASLNRYKVGFCPEGRKFTTPAMARTHTDRPFWSGCLGLVPVSENSHEGGRLDELADADLIVRYPHADLGALRDACERALAVSTEDRRRIHDHFNRHETVGGIVAEAIAHHAADGLSSLRRSSMAR